MNYKSINAEIFRVTTGAGSNNSYPIFKTKSCRKWQHSGNFERFAKKKGLTEIV